MVKLAGETEDERRERKRLKKLAKGKAAASENDDSLMDASINGEEVEKKKKKKDKNKNEKNGIENGTVNGTVNGTENGFSSAWVDTIKKKKNKKDKNKNETENKENSTKKPRKRKHEKVTSDEDSGDVDGFPPVKKNKEAKAEPPKEDHWTPEQKGTFRKIFYRPTETTTNMADEKVDEFRKKNNMILTGRLSEIYKPTHEFDDFCRDDKIMSVTKGFNNPTPIQAQCWPIIGSGRDIIGIAETGSGKTLAFSLPALQHILHRYENPSPGLPKNPYMLVLAPTRELAMQTQTVMEDAGKESHITSVCCYGGVPKWEQKSALRWGVEVVVATPGRLKDLVNMGAVKLSGISYLVLDEADRMLDQGFEDDIREIIGMTHPERQTCLFSATWPEAIRNLAQEFLTDPIKVTIGSDSLTANTRIKQIVEVIQERDKMDKLHKTLQQYSNEGTKNRMIVFVLKKAEARDVEDELRHSGYRVDTIHGDKTQWERTKALEKFKEGKINVLVATDVAARGLDIPDVEYVINYSFPLTIEDYVHRIGRTGRAGKEGLAHSFFHRGDQRNAGSLVKILKDAGQEVPKEMLQFDLRIKARTFEKFFNKDGGNARPPAQCFKCGDTGHSARACQGAGNAPSSEGCFKCGEEGHMSRECPKGGGMRGGRGGRGGGRGGGSGGGGGCFKCGEDGHFSRECPKGGGGGGGGGFRGRGRGRS